MAALTRATVELITVGRLLPFLTAASLATTVVGSNTDLNDPINWALDEVGIHAADITLVTDADLSGVAVSTYNEYLSLVELATIEKLLGHLMLADITAGPRSEKMSQHVVRLENRLERLTEKLRNLYGYGRGKPIAGYVMDDFAERVE